MQAFCKKVFNNFNFNLLITFFGGKYCINHFFALYLHSQSVNTESVVLNLLTYKNNKTMKNTNNNGTKMTNFEVLVAELQKIAEKYNMTLNLDEVEELDMITFVGKCSKSAYDETRWTLIKLGVELCYEAGEEKTRIFADKNGIDIMLKDNLVATWGKKTYKPL